MDGPVTTIAKAKPIQCRRDEYLVEKEDGTKVCLVELGAGKIGYVGIPPRHAKEATINLEEPIPPKKTEKMIPPPSSVESKPTPAEELKKLITGKAEYRCKTRMPYLEEEEVTRDISIPAIPNESAELTSARLEKAARDVANTIHGCFDVRFIRFLPTAGAALEGKKVEEKKPASSLPRSYAQAMDDCRRATGSYALCKPQP